MLVEAKCTSCGAALRIDSSREAAVCEHCSTPFVVEKAINNYNTSINMSGGVVQVGENSLPQLLLNASTFARLGSTDSMLATYRRITELYPNNEEGWWGYFQCMTRNGTHMSLELGKIARSAFVIVSDPARRGEIETYLACYQKWEDLMTTQYFTVDERAGALQEKRQRQSQKIYRTFRLVMIPLAILCLLLMKLFEDPFDSFSESGLWALCVGYSVFAVPFYIGPWVMEQYFSSPSYLSLAKTSLRNEAVRDIGESCAKSGHTYELPEIPWDSRPRI